MFDDAFNQCFALLREQQHEFTGAAQREHTASVMLPEEAEGVSQHWFRQATLGVRRCPQRGENSFPFCIHKKFVSVAVTRWRIIPKNRRGIASLRRQPREITLPRSLRCPLASASAGQRPRI